MLIYLQIQNQLEIYLPTFVLRGGWASLAIASSIAPSFVPFTLLTKFKSKSKAGEP